MKRKQVYAETKEFLLGRKGSILGGMIVIFVINYVLNTLFKTSTSITPEQMEAIMNGVVLEEVATITMTQRTFSFLIGIVNQVFTAALSVAILQTVLNGGVFRIKMMLENVKKHWLAYATIGAVLSLISTVLGLISINFLGLSFIISLITTVLTYMIAFAYFLVTDNSVSTAIDAIKESIQLTNGKKMDLFLMGIHYGLLMLTPLIPFTIGTVMILSQNAAGVPIFIFSVILLLAFIIYFGIYSNVATVIYYRNEVIGNSEDAEIMNVVENIIGDDLA